MKGTLFVFVLFLVFVSFFVSGCETEEPQHNKIYANEPDYCATCSCNDVQCLQECQKCEIMRDR